MKISTTRLFTFFTILPLVFLSCKDNSQKGNEVKQTFLDSLVEEQIGGMNYYISLPINFSIEKKEGPDFSVFYFANTDTTAANSFSGGMYFGNHPSEFPPENDSCKVETIDSKILAESSTWTVYKCNGEFLAQTIVDSRSDERWNNQIHVFGHAKKEVDLDKVLAIYSTLRKMD